MRQRNDARREIRTDVCRPFHIPGVRTDYPIERPGRTTERGRQDPADNEVMPNSGRMLRLGRKRRHWSDNTYSLVLIYLGTR